MEEDLLDPIIEENLEPPLAPPLPDLNLTDAIDWDGVYSPQYLGDPQAEIDAAVANYDPSVIGDLGFDDELAAAFQTNNLTSLLRQHSSHQFQPDPDFNTDRFRVRFDEIKDTLAEDYWRIIAPSTSDEEFDYRYSQALTMQENMQTLSDSGWSGTGALLIAGVADPAAIAVGVVTGSLGFWGSKAALAGRTGMIIGSAAGAAAGNVAVEYGLDLGGRPTNSTDYMIAAGIGMVLGGVGGAFATNPATRADAIRQAEVGQAVLERELTIAGREYVDLEATTALQSTLSAAEAPTPPAFLNNAVLESLLDQDVAQSAGFGRFDIAGVVGQSDNALTRLFGQGLFRESVGLDDFSATQFSVDQDLSRLTLRYMVPARRLEARAFRDWATDRGLNPHLASWGRSMNDFQEEVTAAIRSDEAFERSHDAVRQMAEEYRRGYNEMLQDLQNPRRREGLVGRPVFGFENVEDNRNYFPRLWNRNVIRNEVSTSAGIGQSGIERLFRGAIQRAQPEISGDILDALAQGMARGITRNSFGMDDPWSMAFARSDKDKFGELLKDLVPELEESQADAILDRLFDTKGRGTTPARSKRRVLLDEEFEMNLPQMDGIVRRVRLTDMTVNDAGAVYQQYSRQAAGLVSLARFRAVNPQTGEQILDGITSQAERSQMLNMVRQYAVDNQTDLKQLNKDLRLLEFGFDRILGVPLDSQQGWLADTLRTLRQIQFTRVMNQVGFAQLGEMAAITSTLGIRAALQQLPSFKRVIRNRDPRLANELMDELESIVGLGTDPIIHQAQYRFEEHAGFFNSPDQGSRAARVENYLQKANRITSNISGMNFLTSLQQRWTGAIVAQKFANMARKGAPESLRRRLRSIGLDDDMLDRVLEQTKHFTKEDGLFTPNKVTRLNLANWDDLEARAAFENALFAMSRKLVQTNDIGTQSTWMSDPMFQTFLQFRSFGLTSWANHFLHNIHMRDMRSFQFFMQTLVLGGMVYAAQEQLKAVGRSDADEYLEQRLSTENLAKAAFQRSAWSSLLPSAIDSAMFIAGQDPLFAFRASDLDVNFLTGNPSVDFIGALAETPQNMLDGEFSERDARDLLRLAPFGNFLPFQTLLSTMIQDLPDR